MDVRVMSYNVRYAGADDGPQSWANRRDAVATTVRFHRPDVVGVQECWGEQFQDLKARLPDYDWAAVSDDLGEHTPVAYRRDRLTATSVERVGLTDADDDRTPGWDATYPRYMTNVTFRTGDGGRFEAHSLHLDHEGTVARRESARLVRERVGTPAVVLGDYNCEPGSEPYRLLTDRFGDAREHAAYRHGPVATYVGFEDPDPMAGKRIDYVFFTPGIEVEGYGVGTDVDATGRYPSDHLPVVADLSVPTDT
jgi:endonuclease/exonuclease/phosphatase family metal-dependent hydrolase